MDYAFHAPHSRIYQQLETEQNLRTHIFICKVKRQSNYVHEVALNDSNISKMFPSIWWFRL